MSETKKYAANVFAGLRDDIPIDYLARPSAYFPSAHVQGKFIEFPERRS